MCGLASVERAIHVLSWDHSWLERLVWLSERGLGLLWMLDNQATFLTYEILE